MTNVQVNRRYKDSLFRMIFRGKPELPELYSRKQLALPTPRYIVFFNGGQDMPDRTELRL